MAVAIPELRTRRLLLTIPGAAAAEARVRYNRENENHLAPWNPTTRHRDLDVGYWRAALDARQTAFHTGNGYAFSIFEREAGLAGPLLGHVNFSAVVRGVFLACYLGYDLAERAQGRGYMAEACEAGIDYIFNRVRLHRIMANYVPHNARSAAVLRRLGFVIEGRADAYLHIAGAWREHILTSLTNPTPVLPEDLA